MEKIPMTLQGYKSLEEEHKKLKYEERPAVIKAIAEAREHGDLSENAEYHSAKELQSIIEGRITELEDKIRRAEVINISNIKSIEKEEYIKYDNNSYEQYLKKFIKMPNSPNKSMWAIIESIINQ